MKQFRISGNPHEGTSIGIHFLQRPTSSNFFEKGLHHRFFQSVLNLLMKFRGNNILGNSSENVSERQLSNERNSYSKQELKFTIKC